MESKKLAALISSLISDLLLLLLLLFPSSNSFDSSSNHFNSNCYANFFPLIHHLLSSQETAASLSILNLSKKRKRTHFSEPDSESTHEDKSHGPFHRLSELARVVQNPDSFRTFFKMKASTFEWLSGLLEPLLDCRDPIGSPLSLSAELRLGVGLFRLATGSNYSEIADRFGVTESAARFCAKQLCRVLCTNFRFWVSFPSPVELQSVSNAFEKLIGLPNCCGVIDSARFNLVKKADDKLASNGKDQDDMIAAQIVVDSSSRILSIVAGFRGEKGNSRMLKSTTLYKDIEGGRVLNSSPEIVNGVAINRYLIGGGRYPLLPWLMVPFLDALPGSCEEKFNKANDLMRVSSLRAIASLKNWGVLSRPIQEEFKTAVALIGACSILHNALLMREDDSALLDMGGYSLYNQQCSQHFMDAEVEDISRIDGKASEIRNALATKVAVFHES
ncbi:protein ANTAGONIST OF LIKE HETEROCHROMATIN PROTEIN 1 [Ricinus communis]|uniref:protein ANTAGONIST OF LIKE HETEROCHROMATIN PROTEIN 1 n=1 Tax=Ricinus communis TaxID=3988 RepID=UPI00201B1F2A|nr:protein ANTAGONIST OF LIKE HETEROCHROMATIN PROTEIN 1 [Ricinus communis]